jgi:lipopolysaccharide transport system ATP-binding protein
MPAIIKVENLSKQYRIGAAQASYTTLRETLMGAVRAPFSRRASAGTDTIWSIRDVSFEIERGEVVGIIGRNGAGKSTLLKLLSRITEPTRGRIEMYGRASSLLEVGTGFHPELTGRENVYLNGAVLGMPRADIARKFDEIVAFAEVERFIDTPVKHYSSGMYLRLAFAVAAHLEPEILIVDEVLAVGDAKFQRKCLDKMQDVGREGRTVLFVSHNMSAITRLCPRTILLEAGQILTDGPSHEVVSVYLNVGLGTTAERLWKDAATAPTNDGVARLRAVRVRDESGLPVEAVDIRRPVFLEMEFDVVEEGHVFVPAFSLHNEEGLCIFITHDCDPEWRGRARPVGSYKSVAVVPGNFLSEGSIVVGVAVSAHVPSVHVHAYFGEAVAFQVIDSSEGDAARGDYAGPMPGVVRPLLEWRTEFAPQRALSSSGPQ